MCFSVTQYSDETFVSIGVLAERAIHRIHLARALDAPGGSRPLPLVSEPGSADE